MLRYILIVLLVWFLYVIVFRFIIPVYMTTRALKKKFREMNQEREDQLKQEQGFADPSSGHKPTSSSPVGDYIDFEEIK
jgi:hypothetical protein